MSDFDVHALDGRIRAQLRKQRSALAQLEGAADDAPKRAYLDSRLWSRGQRELLKGSHTPHAASALAWIDALHDAFQRWRLRYHIASRWQPTARWRRGGAVATRNARAAAFRQGDRHPTSVRQTIRRPRRDHRTRHLPAAAPALARGERTQAAAAVHRGRRRWCRARLGDGTAGTYRRPSGAGATRGMVAGHCRRLGSRRR